VGEKNILARYVNLWVQC